MTNAIYTVSFKLKKGTNTQEFLAAAKALNDNYISKQPGYISWQQGFDKEKELWADFCTFASMEDAQNFLKNSETPNEHALAFYSFLNLPSCVSRLYSVEVTHKNT